MYPAKKHSCFVGDNTNNGELFNPARPLPPMKLQRISSGESAIDPLRGKWSLVYIGVGDCDADCRQALLTMRQTRLSLNQEMDRVDFPALHRRLSQNSVQEKLNKLWIDRCLQHLGQRPALAAE